MSGGDRRVASLLAMTHPAVSNKSALGVGINVAIDLEGKAVFGI